MTQVPGAMHLTEPSGLPDKLKYSNKWTLKIEKLVCIIWMDPM